MAINKKQRIFINKKTRVKDTVRSAYVKKGGADGCVGDMFGELREMGDPGCLLAASAS